MELVRDSDAGRINAVLNDPRVRPWVADAGEGILDIAPAVANRDNVLLMGEYGGLVFFKRMPSIYEVHTQVLPEGRGKWALEMMRAAAAWMFIRTDCCEIVTRIPQGHIAARAAAMALGMRHEFTREEGCRFRGKDVPVHIHCLRIQDWAIDAPGLIEQGEWFHRRLGEEARRLGIAEPLHAPDENHNRYVGGAIAMAMHGQPVKATAFYNRWALAARHAPVALVSVNPVVARFDIGLLRVTDDIEVIPCV